MKLDVLPGMMAGAVFCGTWMYLSNLLFAPCSGIVGFVLLILLDIWQKIYPQSRGSQVRTGCQFLFAGLAIIIAVPCSR